jgi:plastocyanin
MKRSSLQLVLIGIVLVALVVTCAGPLGSEAEYEAESNADDSPQLLIDIEHTGSAGGDFAEYHGFFIESYPGSTLETVELLLRSEKGGDAELTLKAWKNNYSTSGDADAEELGASTSVGNLPASGSMEWITFDFAAVPVDPGELVTFEIEVNSSNGGIVFYAVDAKSAPSGSARVIQTNGSTDIYDQNGVYHKRREPIPIRVTGKPAP